MLHTTERQLRRFIPRAQPVLDTHGGSFRQRVRSQAFQMVPARGDGRHPLFSLRLFGQRCLSHAVYERFLSSFLGSPLKRLGLAMAHQTEALIDLSGFAYGSAWNERAASSFAQLASLYQRQGKKVLLLPQAFGPFETDSLRRSMRQIVKASNLVCPRDDESKTHLMALGLSPEDQSKVFQAPDVTLQARWAGLAHEKTAPYVSLVPNARMLDKSCGGWKNRYSELFRTLTDHLLRQGLAVKIVLHETSGEDLELVKKIWASGLPEGVTLHQDEEPLETKRLLARSLYVAGSRYHALAGALSCGVPALGLGWSSKYSSLFELYDCPEFCFTTPQNDAVLMQSLDRLHESRNLLKEKLLKAQETIDRRLDALWQRVSALLLGS